MNLFDIIEDFLRPQPLQTQAEYKPTVKWIVREWMGTQYVAEI